MRRKLERCINVRDVRDRAGAVLPAPVLGYLEGGADDEYTLERNLAAFRDFELLPRFLVDVGETDLATHVLGVDLDFPVLLAPTGMSRLFHPEAELAVARAAASSGTMYCLSTVATESIESVAAVSNGAKMYQVYVFRDRGLNTEFVRRCKEAGYDAMCLTVDVPVGGNRERDHRTGMALPPRFGWRSKLSFATHPTWSLGQLGGPAFDLPNVSRQFAGKEAGLAERLGFLFSQFDATVTWSDAERLIAEWDGPFAIKGILSADDARRAVSIGATAVIVSNHGGRQLDTVPATMDCLTAIVDTVGDQAEVIVDGGIRRGTDVLKALAIGAKACMIGRPYVYGLATAGEAGVAHVLDIFRTEIDRDLALIGCRRPGELDRDFVRHRTRSLAEGPA
ncbi:MAG: alpha-hydroxy acid oxidase [Gammaproteobacteria bacterium]